jgi:diguanylate cyclase (GGDEF)-like protein
VGRDLGLFMPLDDANRPDIEQLLAETLRAGSLETEGWRVRRDGVRFWESMVITALPDEAGVVSDFVVVSKNIMERKRAEDDLTLLAAVDPLTGAYNRRQGEVLLGAEFDRRARDRRDFAVLTLDIDHFKAVNDRFGHSAGDEVLRAMVLASQRALRAIDVLVRWGGEEFLVILPNTDESGAVVVAERLRAALEATEIEAADMTRIRITVSIGVAAPRNDDRGELLHRADTALYAAKRGGRNRVVLAT